MMEYDKQKLMFYHVRRCYRIRLIRTLLKDMFSLRTCVILFPERNKVFLRSTHLQQSCWLCKFPIVQRFPLSCNTYVHIYHITLPIRPFCLVLAFWLLGQPLSVRNPSQFPIPRYLCRLWALTDSAQRRGETCQLALLWFGKSLPNASQLLILTRWCRSHRATCHLVYLLTRR